ncbi:amidase domain-containing protein [Halalkalibacter oceani]|uniref:amidase domain-containing protein n=1 Tax=Halalkalibacter oceani TaxID=1653776 RepID=UPI00339ADB04
MNNSIVRMLHHHIEKENKAFVEPQKLDRTSLSAERAQRTVQMHEKRSAKIVRSYVEGDVLRTIRVGTRQIIDYFLHCEQLIALKDTVYLEEKLEFRRATIEDKQVKSDEELFHLPEKKAQARDSADVRQSKKGKSAYNRREAVRYAELWWDDYNPAYHRFTDNCTNFISQCLYAGGARMTGYPNRATGWWYQGGNWSFSWSVAHSLRWHLSGSKDGLRGEERQSAKELEPGDVICYDFNGDGRWQHSTIVVAKDANGEPLVNAQSSNSRMRYWAYEDSTAWTPQINYKFFHIIDDA